MKRENMLFYIWQAALALPLTGFMWSGTRPDFSCSETAASALFLLLMAAVLSLLILVTGRKDWVFQYSENCVQKENISAETGAETDREGSVVSEGAAFGRRAWLLQFLVFVLAAALYFCYVFILHGWIDSVKPSWLSSKILDSLTAGGLFCIAALFPVRQRLL